TEEIPIKAVTNGVHAKTWVSAEMADLLSRYVLPEWDEAGPDRWDRIDEARDDEVWRAKEQGREQLVAFIRRRLRESSVARALYQGADVWLNNPRRPLEACGTSGMKAALNGGLNASILDGWWDELFNGENGWAISSAEQLDDEERRDELEANSLFEILER